MQQLLALYIWFVDGPLIDMDFTPTADTVALSAMGTPSEFDRRKKKK